MPRGYYLKYFARDKNDEYIGTEPEREWSETELEERFGKFREFEMPRWVKLRSCEGNVYLAEDRDEGTEGEGLEGNASESEVEWKEAL